MWRRRWEEAKRMDDLEELEKDPEMCRKGKQGSRVTHRESGPLSRTLKRARLKLVAFLKSHFVLLALNAAGGNKHLTLRIHPNPWCFVETEVCGARRIAIPQQ